MQCWLCPLRGRAVLTGENLAHLAATQPVKPAGRSQMAHCHSRYTASRTLSPAGRLSALLSGWRVNAILATDHANVGAGPAQRPDQSGDPNLTGGDRVPTRWFDVDAFALPAPFTFGSAPRNSVIGPGYANIDLVLARTWLVAARRSLELRWEVFNLFNRTNFDLPNRVFGNPNFGRIFSAKDPRQMQFGARLTF